MRYLFALLCIVAAVYAAPNVRLKLSEINPFPTVGKIFGPVVLSSSPKFPGGLTQIGTQYYYEIDIKGTNSLPKSLVLPNQIFNDVKEMRTYVDNSLTDDTAVVEIGPYKLNGRHLEVLRSKAIPPRDLKITCHYPSNRSPPICKDLTYSDHPIKLTYSMVRLLDDNTVFPVMFISHKVCPEESFCFWYTHPAEIAVVDKSII